MKARIVPEPELFALRLLKLCCVAVFREIYLFWRVVRYDVPASIFPGMLFAVSAWHFGSDFELEKLPAVLVKSFVYFSFYIYTFCLANQLVGVEEDRLNKPDRPLVTGETSITGFKVRLIISLLLFDIVGWELGVIEWTLLWQFVIVSHNLLGWAQHWFFKSLAMGLGTLAMLAPAWQLVRPITPLVWNWIILASVAVFALIHLQDHRDIIGDKAVNRRTVPLVFGEVASRLYLGIGFAVTPIAVHFFLMEPAGTGWQVLVCETILTVLSLVIAVRVLFLRSIKTDHITYMLYPYWFCCLLASSIIIL